MEDIIRHFEPDYVLLRPGDLERFADPAGFQARYSREAGFSVPPEELVKIPWREYNIDTVFDVYRRCDPLAAPG